MPIPHTTGELSPTTGHLPDHVRNLDEHPVIHHIVYRSVQYWVGGGSVDDVTGQGVPGVVGVVCSALLGTGVAACSVVYHSVQYWVSGGSVG